MGPNFCEKVKFDPSLIEPIESKLALAWYEISEKKEPTEFWTHEWVKHGSCAKALPQFETELKYFESGLQLRTKYDLYVSLSLSLSTVFELKHKKRRHMFYKSVTDTIFFNLGTLC
jgi:ribonuclease T2